MFYVYLWLRYDGTPYYVGKGQRNRAIRKGSPQPEFIIIQTYESEAEAFEAEKFLISYYGRKDLKTGILRNLTDGGDGVSGYKRNPQWSANHARAITGKKLFPNGRVFTEQHIENIRRAHLGKPSPKKGIPVKTHCIWGHERTFDNVKPDGGCKRCAVIGNKRRIETRKVANG